MSQYKSICDSVRSKVRARLRGRFDRLLDQKRPSVCAHATTYEVDQLQTQSTDACDSTSARVTVISDVLLSQNALSLLFGI